MGIEQRKEIPWGGLYTEDQVREAMRDVSDRVVDAFIAENMRRNGKILFREGDAVPPERKEE